MLHHNSNRKFSSPLKSSWYNSTPKCCLMHFSGPVCPKIDDGLDCKISRSADHQQDSNIRKIHGNVENMEMKTEKERGNSAD